MSVIYIDGLVIRLVSDTHNKFNPLYAFGRSDCGVLALRDIQEDHLLLPCDAEGNVVVTPGRRYQIVTVVERRSATSADQFHAKHSPPQTTTERNPAQQRGVLDENKNDHSSLPKLPQHTASNVKGHNKSETAKAKGYPRVSTRDERSHEEHEEQKKDDRCEDNEKMKNGKEFRRSHKSPKDECNKNNNNSTNCNELRGERTSPQVSSHGEDIPNGQKQQQHPKQKAKQRYEEDEKERKRPRTSTSKTPSPIKNNNNKGDHVEAEESRERKVPHVELCSGPSGVTSPHHSSMKSPRSELTAAATTPPSIPSMAKHGVKHQPQVFSSSSSSDDEEDEMPVVVWHAQRCAHSHQKQQEQQQQRSQQNKKEEGEKSKAETGRTDVGPRNRTAKKVPPPLQGDTSSDSD